MTTEIAEAALDEIERLSDMHSIMLSSTSLKMLAEGYLTLFDRLRLAEEALRRIAEEADGVSLTWGAGRIARDYFENT